MPESYQAVSGTQEEKQPAEEPEAGQGNAAAKIKETGQGNAGVKAKETEQGNAAAENEEAEPGNAAVETEKTDEKEDVDLNLAFTLVTGDAAMEGLSQEAVNQISAINAGEPPAKAVGAKELEGYYALVATYTVVGKDKTSGEETRGSGRLTLYIPNLLEGLDGVSFLFYDRAEGTWRIIPAEEVDTEAKTVSAVLPGSGTLTVIYRRE